MDKEKSIKPSYAWNVYSNSRAYSHFGGAFNQGNCTVETIVHQTSDHTNAAAEAGRKYSFEELMSDTALPWLQGMSREPESLDKLKGRLVSVNILLFLHKKVGKTLLK